MRCIYNTYHILDKVHDGICLLRPPPFVNAPLDVSTPRVVWYSECTQTWTGVITLAGELPRFILSPGYLGDGVLLHYYAVQHYSVL